MSEQQVWHREAVRVVLVDRDDRVLLIEAHDPHRTDLGWYWITPGGGLEADETVPECAVREVREETGLELDPDGLGTVRHESTVEFGFEGHLIRQHQVFLVVEVEPFAIDTSGWEEPEVRSQGEVRWWDLAELAASGAAYYPEDLADVVSTTRRSG